MDASVIETVMKAVSLVAAIVFLYSGVRRLRKYGISKEAATYAAVGFLYLSMHAGYGMWSARFVNETVTTLSKGTAVPQLADDWGKDISQQERFEKSQFLARMAYTDHGEIRHYFNQEGVKVLFAPSREELNEREGRVADLAKLSFLADLNANNALQWVVIMVAAVLFGLGTARSKSSNSALDKDVPAERPST